MKSYKSLFTRSREQNPSTAFAFFPYPRGENFETPLLWLAEKTKEGVEGWAFKQEKYKTKYAPQQAPKLRNYIDYTFMRLLRLEEQEPGKYFVFSDDKKSVCFNSGLHDRAYADLILYFEEFDAHGDTQDHSDWVYKGYLTPQSAKYKDLFGATVPEIAWYTKDSKDFVFDLQYYLNPELNQHVFDRAKERIGLADSPDEFISNYLRGVIENIRPRLMRNYKTAVPVYYVRDQKMQMLIPFMAKDGISAFMIDRDDARKVYNIITILEMDQAFFSARLITRPDEEWLDP